jgi:hypothetical protein
MLPSDGVGAFNELESSNVLLEGALTHLRDTMSEITKECTKGGVTFCEHATLIMRVVA